MMDLQAGDFDNPPKDTTGFDPAKLPVRAVRRPASLRDLLTNTDVLYSDWDYDVGNRRLYYVTGIVRFMKLFNTRRITFLKESESLDRNLSFIDQALNVVTEETSWSREASFSWLEPVAANQLRKIRNKSPVPFTKAVHTIVACELALKEMRPDMSQYWVYDYMRIIPAVFNIDGFSEDAVKSVLRTPNGLINVRNIAGFDGEQVLHDLAAGHCVTSKTAFPLARYISGYVPDAKIGAVRCKPGRKRLGRGDASVYEDVIIL